MNRQLAALTAGAIFVASAGAALAHHSFAMFDSDQKVTLSGTVKDFQWVNPHAWIFVMVPGHDGKAEQWAVEMDVTVTIHPLRDGTNGGQFVGLTLPDGSQFGNPERPSQPGPGPQGPV